MAAYTVYRARDLRDGAHKTTLRSTVSSLAISHLLSIQYRLKDTRHTAYMVVTPRARSRCEEHPASSELAPAKYTLLVDSKTHTPHGMPTNVWHTAHTINDERGNTTAACVIKWMNRHTPHGMRTHMCGTPCTICDQRHTRPAGSQSGFKDTRHTACPHTMCGTPRTIRDQRTHGQVGHKVDLKTRATHGMTTHLWHTAHDPRPKAQTASWLTRWIERHTPHGMPTQCVAHHVVHRARSATRGHTANWAAQSGFKDTRHTACPHNAWHTAHDPRPEAQTANWATRWT
jgi:hypothetical protein